MTFVVGEQVGRPGANKGERYPAELLTQEEVDALFSRCHVALRQRSGTG